LTGPAGSQGLAGCADAATDEVSQLGQVLLVGRTDGNVLGAGQFGIGGQMRHLGTSGDQDVAEGLQMFSGDCALHQRLDISQPDGRVSVAAVRDGEGHAIHVVLLVRQLSGIVIDTADGRVHGVVQRRCALSHQGGVVGVLRVDHGDEAVDLLHSDARVEFADANEQGLLHGVRPAGADDLEDQLVEVVHVAHGGASRVDQNADQGVAGVLQSFEANPGVLEVARAGMGLGVVVVHAEAHVISFAG